MVINRGQALLGSLSCSIINLTSITGLSLPDQKATPAGCTFFNQAVKDYHRNDRARAETNFLLALESSQRYLAPTRSLLPQSIPLADLATRLYPADPQAWKWSAEAHVEDPRLAINSLVRAAELLPSDNLIWEKAGILADGIGEFDLASRAFKNACDINPVRNGACLRTAAFAYERGEWEAVIHYSLIATYPESAEGWRMMIEAATELGRTQDAQEYLLLAKESFPEDFK